MRGFFKYLVLFPFFFMIGLHALIADHSFSIKREQYLDAMAGFWLGQCIANWTGLTPEMDKVAPPFYTDASWGGPDELSVWGEPGPRDVLEFYLEKAGTPWGADDDTDIEYLYLHLLHQHQVTRLTGEQIQKGWLEHMWSDDYNKNGNNFLWVSNENAFELMRKGLVPPETSRPDLNPEFDKIDAQLTTEIFGLFAPIRSEVAIEIAELPIRTSARANAQLAAEFYVRMHSRCALHYAECEEADEKMSLFERLMDGALFARGFLPEESYLADMYDFIWKDYQENPNIENWEQTRDRVFERYQIEGAGGYRYEQPYDAGINFAAGLISLFYGQGDFKRTIRIGSLVGWDCDNPTATWGGLIGFLMGAEKLNSLFSDTPVSQTYQISRTRRNFPDHTPDLPGEDTFALMAERCCEVVERVVVEELGGGLDESAGIWNIPSK